MCIYFKDKPDLTYKNQEHIFSDTVGGMRRLPRGYVSDEANTIFSKLELKAFRQSTISLNRLILGPGKKGTHDNKPKTPVNVIIYDDGDYGLGFIHNMTEYIIPHGYLHNGILRWGCLADDGMQKVTQLIVDLKNFNGKIIRKTESSIPQESLLFGIYNEVLYIGAGDDSISDEKALKIIHAVIGLTENKEGTTSSKKSPGKHSLHFQEDNDIARVYGKTALNVLAFIAGEEYARNSAFDKFRNWIITGENMDNYLELPKLDIEDKTFPEKSHWCILLNIKGSLCAVVCYHNTLKRRFPLGNAIDTRFAYPDGFICDWLNKKEYTLLEWIKQISIISG